MANLTSSLTIKLLDQVSGPAGKAAGALRGLGASGKDLGKLGGANVDKLIKQLDELAQKSAKVKDLGKAGAGVKEAAAGFREARQQVEGLTKSLAAAKAAQEALKGVKGKENERAAAAIEVKRLTAELNASTSAAAKAKAAFADQVATVRNLRSSLAGAGSSFTNLRSAEAGLKTEILATNAALKQQIGLLAKAERNAVRKKALGTVAGGVGVMASTKGKAIGLDAIQSAADFDIAVRKQRVFNDLGKDDQAALLKQAKQIGQETQFSNIDVVKAQTASMQGLPADYSSQLKAEVAQGIIENVRNYSTLMETDLKEGAELIRSYLTSTGRDISTKEKALAEANKATNQLVKMAKLGGMNGEDVQNYVNYAASSGTVAGITPESMMTLGALARRGGLRGDVAGVAVRSMAGKIVSPTNKGLAALNAAGINYNDYVHMPDQLSTGGLEGQFRLGMGKGFSPEIRKKIDAINADKSLIADRGKYVEAVTQAVSPMLGKTKNGKVRASDAKVAAKAAGDFHKLSAQNVDAEGLLDAAFSKGMTLAQLNAWLTDKHGGKGAITAKQWEEFGKSRAEIKKAGDDPNYAATRAKEVMDGLGGSVENLKGSFENFVLNLGTANENLIKFSADGLGGLIDKFSNLSTTTQQVLTVLGGGAALGGGALGAYTLAKNLLGGGGASVALNGSAAALTAAAAELTAAAAAQAGKGAAGAAAAAANAGAPAVAGLGVLGTLGLFGIGAGTIAGAGFAGYATAQQMPKVLAEQGPAAVDPATGGATEANPMDGLGPDRPYATEWLQRKFPSVFGGTPSIGGSGAPAPGAGGSGAPVEAGKADTSGLEQIEQKAGDAKAKLDEVSGVNVKPNVDPSGLDALIAKAKEALSSLLQIQSAAGQANSAIASVNAGSGRVRQALGDNHGGG